MLNYASLVPLSSLCLTIIPHWVVMLGALTPRCFLWVTECVQWLVHWSLLHLLAGRRYRKMSSSHLLPVGLQACNPSSWCPTSQSSLCSVVVDQITSFQNVFLLTVLNYVLIMLLFSEFDLMHPNRESVHYSHLFLLFFSQLPIACPQVGMSSFLIWCVTSSLLAPALFDPSACLFLDFLSACDWPLRLTADTVHLAFTLPPWLAEPPTWVKYLKTSSSTRLSVIPAVCWKPSRAWSSGLLHCIASVSA